MLSQKSLMKGFVIVILVIFLLSSALVSVMYFFDMQTKAAEAASGAVDTGIVSAIEDFSGAVDTGVILSGN